MSRSTPSTPRARGALALVLAAGLALAAPGCAGFAVEPRPSGSSLRASAADGRPDGVPDARWYGALLGGPLLLSEIGAFLLDVLAFPVMVPAYYITDDDAYMLPVTIAVTEWWSWTLNDEPSGMLALPGGVGTSGEGALHGAPGGARALEGEAPADGDALDGEALEGRGPRGTTVEAGAGPDALERRTVGRTEREVEAPRSYTTPTREDSPLPPGDESIRGGTRPIRPGPDEGPRTAPSAPEGPGRPSAELPIQPPAD